MAIKNNKINLIPIFTLGQIHHIAMIQNTKNAMAQMPIGLYQNEATMAKFSS